MLIIRKIMIYCSTELNDLDYMIYIKLSKLLCQVQPWVQRIFFFLDGVVVSVWEILGSQ